MSSRQAIFRIAQEPDDDNVKLKELFRNRAELKKEFAALDKEKRRLQRLIRQQQDASAKIAQRLEHLEGLLLDPEWVHTVAVFYQLRAVNRRCRDKLERFAEKLKQQRAKRRRGIQRQAWRRHRDTVNAAVRNKLLRLREQMRSLDDQLQAERQREESISGLSRLFKGRSTPGQLSGIGARLDTAREAERALLQELETVENEQPPDPPGLSVQEKRSINYMIIAFAQHLYLQFNDRNLVSLVRESGEKRAGAINYGNKPDCDALLGRIIRHVESMEAGSECADILKRRAELIAEHAVFVEDDDAVPIAGTVATVFAIGADGSVTKSDANLVGDDYWGIAGVLSR